MGWTFIGNTIVNRRGGGQSWSTYWTQRIDKFLGWWFRSGETASLVYNSVGVQNRQLATQNGNAGETFGGRAIWFDNTPQMAYITDDAKALNITRATTDFCVCGWLKYTTNSALAYAFGKGMNTDDGGYYFALYNNALYFGMSSSTGDHSVADNITFALNTWYHVAGRIDLVARKFYFYINGVLQNAGGTSFTGTIADPTKNFLLGCRYKAGASTYEYYSRCQVKDIRIYHSDITSQLTNIMNMERLGNEILWLPCEDENTGILYDASGNDHHATTVSLTDTSYVHANRHSFFDKLGYSRSLLLTDTLLLRGNTVGQKAVTPDAYDTNSGATTITVGASGADYTSLITAYAAAAAGDMIELIDDSLTIGAQLVLTLGVNGGGKAVKIKGKTTKTILVLFNANPSIALTGADAAIEFENIIFSGGHATYSFVSTVDNINGFCHFINCEFNLAGNITLQNSEESVFDGCTFTETNQTRFINVSMDDTLSATAKVIINDCTLDNVCDYFIEISRIGGSGTAKLDYYSITNCNIKTASTVQLINGLCRENRICGNRLESTTGSSIYLGYEASEIDGFGVYNALTDYVTGDLCTNLFNLWECVTNCTGSEPTKANANWKPAELVTGEIENNTLIGAAGTSAHGVFLGYGCYDISFKNNIVTRFSWNIVVKGYNNTIQYNCTGVGYMGLNVFANDQALVANNTFRAESGYALGYGPQDLNGTGPDATIFRDNILTILPTSGNVMSDYYARRVALYNDTNTFNQNVFYGYDVPTASFEGTTHALYLAANFATFKTAIGDANAWFLNPEFLNSVDDTIEAYYTPTNLIIAKLRDPATESVGAIDIKAVEENVATAIPLDSSANFTTDIQGETAVFVGQAQYHLTKVDADTIKMPDHVLYLIEGTDAITGNTWYDASGHGNSIDIANIEDYEAKKQYFNDADESDLIIILDPATFTDDEDEKLKTFTKV